MKKYIGTKIIMAEPQEKDGKAGYKVQYEDGYISWSPKDVFGRAYRAFDGGMDFGNAISLLKMGFRLKRRGWEDGAYIFLENDTLIMHTLAGALIVCCVTDTYMLAEDWIVVD